MGNLDVQIIIFFGAMALSYGVAAWRANVRRGEDLTTSLTHGPALIVLLIGFLVVVGGGTWLVGLIVRLLFGS